MGHRPWLFAVLALTLLSSGAAAPLQNDNGPRNKPPPCEDCAALLAQSSAILEKCQGMDGDPQMACLEAFDKVADQYEACALRRLEESAPICTPPPEGAGNGPPGGAGDTANQNGKDPACDTQGGQGGYQSCSYVTNKPPAEPVPDESENPPPQPPPQPDRPPPESDDDKKGGAEGHSGSGDDPQPAAPTGDGPIKNPPDTSGPVKDGGGSGKPPAGGGPSGPGGSTGPVIDGMPIPMGGSGGGSGGGACPEATQGLAASKTVVSPDLFLDRVGMPLYLPKAFKQSAFPSEITPEKLAWIVAHSMIEKGTSRPTVFGEANNIFSIQLDASVLDTLNKSSGGRFSQLIGGGLKKGETCEYKGDSQKALPNNSICKGWRPFESGKWIVSTQAMIAKYNDYVAALEGYLIFLKHYRPAAYAALVNPSSTLRDYANGLKGYGNGRGYGKGAAETDHLIGLLKTQMKAQTKYLDARIGRMASGSCGGMAAQRTRLEDIRAEARKY